MTPEELADYFREALGEKVTDASVTYGQLTVTLEPDALPDAARLCKEDPELDFAFFDFMSGVDMKEEGFAVITHLYSVEHQHHVTLRALAPGGRDEPTLPSITGVYRGADWHEREAYDMFGVEFEGHPGLLPRILTVENFEGFPLRKEFLLTTREAKPWPGLKEPKEDREDEETGEGDEAAPAAAEDDKAQAAKDKADRAKQKAAAARAEKARQRSQELEADTDAPQEPTEVADAAATAITKDAAAGSAAGDVAEGATQDQPGAEEPVEDPDAEARAAEGAPARPGGSPGVTEGGLGPEPPVGTDEETPRALDPEKQDRPVEPGHTPAADVEPKPKEQFEKVEDDEPGPAHGTDAQRREGGEGP